VLHKSHVLTEDFCIIEGRDHFVRRVLQLRIIGAREERFAYGVWCTLSPVSFRRYCEAAAACRAPRPRTEAAGPGEGGASARAVRALAQRRYGFARSSWARSAVGVWP